MIKDPCFPQMDRASDVVYMRELLQQTLFSNPDDGSAEFFLIELCQIANKRHKPGRSFVLSYRLIVRDDENDERFEQIVSARLCKTGQGLQELDSERKAYRKKMDEDSAVLYLHQLEMLLWLFPEDRKLVHLSKIMNRGLLKSHLDGMLPLLNVGRSSQLLDVYPEVLHHLPERSCMIRYRLTIRDPDTDQEIVKIIYGKNYRDDRGSEVYANMKQLARQLPNCARPLQYDDPFRTLWQSHLPGTPLVWSDLESLKTQELLAKMAECLARFQSCQLNTSLHYGLKEIDEQFRDTVKACRIVEHNLSVQISQWIDQLISIRSDMGFVRDEVNETPIHQDLKLGNFLVDKTDIYLIDLDSVCLGDPLADIGSLVANIYRNGLQEGRKSSDIDAMVGSFLKAYEQSISFGISHSRLNWYISAALVHEVIRRLLRQQHFSGLAHLSQYMDLSRRYADQTREATADV